MTLCPQREECFPKTSPTSLKRHLTRPLQLQEVSEMFRKMPSQWIAAFKTSNLLFCCTSEIVDSSKWIGNVSRPSSTTAHATGSTGMHCMTGIIDHSCFPLVQQKGLFSLSLPFVTLIRTKERIACISTPSHLSTPIHGALFPAAHHIHRPPILRIFCALPGRIDAKLFPVKSGAVYPDELRRLI